MFTAVAVKDDNYNYITIVVIQKISEKKIPVLNNTTLGLCSDVIS